MKFTSTIILLFGLFISLNAQEADTTQVADTTEIRKVESFDKLKATKGINVTLIEGDEESIDVHIKNAPLEDVITEVKNRKLIVKMRTKIYKDVAVQVYITYKSLREIEAGTGATIDADNTIYAENLKLRAGAESSILLDVEVNNLEVSGSTCNIELEGVAEYQSVSIGTGGKYQAYNLNSKETYARATLGSIIEISVREKLSGNAGSGGVVYYKGEPGKVETNVNTGGKVKNES